jgi:hypothetical protein
MRTGDHAAAVKGLADLDDWFGQQRRRRNAGERVASEITSPGSQLVP